MKIRLYVEQELTPNNEFALSEKQTHYLFHVLKQEPNDVIYCFDNKNGEFECGIVSIGKKSCIVKVIKKVAEFRLCPDIWLLFAPIKKDNTDFVIEKATELGVRKIYPVITQRTNSDKVNPQRFSMQAIEAAEQSRRVDLPEIADAVKLEKILADWPEDRVLFFMDETLSGNNVFSVFSDKAYKNKPCAILVGPEGGFAEPELKMLRSKSFVRAVSLGKRILRAETAAISALACWQAIIGDWKDD